MADHEFKQGDTLKPFVVDLTSGGAPADLSGLATRTFVMRKPTAVRGATPKIERALSGGAIDGARMTVTFAAGEVDEPGLYWAQLVCSDGAAGVRTWPDGAGGGAKYWQILIHPDL